jgi:hypothetical protein
MLDYVRKHRENASIAGGAALNLTARSVGQRSEVWCQGVSLRAFQPAGRSCARWRQPVERRRRGQPPGGSRYPALLWTAGWPNTAVAAILDAAEAVGMEILVNADDDEAGRRLPLGW